MRSRTASGTRRRGPSARAVVRCLPESVLVELAEGRLAGPVAADVEAHLDRCATCRRVLVELLRG